MNKGIAGINSNNFLKNSKNYNNTKILGEVCTTGKSLNISSFTIVNN